MQNLRLILCGLAIIVLGGYLFSLEAEDGLRTRLIKGGIEVNVHCALDCNQVLLAQVLDHLQKNGYAKEPPTLYSGTGHAAKITLDHHGITVKYFQIDGKKITVSDFLAPQDYARLTATILQLHEALAWEIATVPR